MTGRPVLSIRSRGFFRADRSDKMERLTNEVFSFGSRWLKADFHLHTRADKEFIYQGEDNNYVNDYVEALVHAGIQLGVITNHNKFDLQEFKSLRKKARKVELNRPGFTGDSIS